MKNITYHFQPVEQCNMCNAPETRWRVLGKRMNTSQGRNPRRRSGLTTSIVQCRNCNLIFSNPLPIPDDINDHYGIPPESYWIPEYFQVHDDYYSHIVTTFKRLYGPSSTQLLTEQGKLRALDVGAGIGKGMIALERAGFDVQAFEPSQPFYERAIEKMNISPERIRLGGIEKMEYEPESFDLVVFSAVLEHVYDPSASITKALSWLKPGGLIHIEVPSSRWLISKVFNAYYRLIGTDYVTNISPMHPPFHLYEFGESSFRRHARRFGYQIAKLDPWVAETMLPKKFDPILKPIMERTKTGMQLDVWMRKKANQ